MSKSATIEEESSWAQTFVTVTPQDDGYLREIDDTCVVSGNADVPLNLDTWNIVLRRSLVNTTKDFIDPRELDEAYVRVTAQCQTYLRGFPRVELPIIYRDEATQTLYIGDNDDSSIETTKLIDGMIAVMNEKPLPKWRKSQIVQTAWTFGPEVSRDFLVTKLQEIVDFDDGTRREIDEFEIDASHEARDIMNFVVDRTLWMTEPANVATAETRDVGSTTIFMYNEVTKKLTIEHEIQTSLSCGPKQSNSAMLADYRARDNYFRETIEECLNNGVDRKIVVDDVVDDIVGRSKRQIDFPGVDERATSDCRLAEYSVKNRYPVHPPSRKMARDEQTLTKLKRTRDILLANNRSYVVSTRSRAASDPNLVTACRNPEISYYDSDGDGETNGSTGTTGIRGSSSESSEVVLTRRDEEALGILKNTFCKSHEGCSCDMERCLRKKAPVRNNRGVPRRVPR